VRIIPVAIAKSQVTVTDVVVTFSEAQVETCVVDLLEPCPPGTLIDLVLKQHHDN
jgi:hypothetical protein